MVLVKKYEMKPLFEEKMRRLLRDEEDFCKFSKVIGLSPRNFIRCNTLKISPENLLYRLRLKGWTVSQLFGDYPEIMLVEDWLEPGELGNALEHTLGYYYVQEVSSMMPVIALDPKPGELVLDLCSSPGSKTTQIAAKMQNLGTVIANDVKIDRISILVSNVERCGATNVITTRADAVSFCSRISKSNFPKFDKILLDAPCSGEGTLRSSRKTFLLWNQKVVEKMSRQQKKFIASALGCLKAGGVLVYSTCTHSPEENESVVNFAVRNFPVRVERLELPLLCRAGISEWGDEVFDNQVRNACRIYPQDNDSEGFFVAKLRLLEEVK